MSPLLFYYILFCKEGFLWKVALSLFSVQHHDKTWNISSNDQLILSESQIYTGTDNTYLNLQLYEC